MTDPNGGVTFTVKELLAQIDSKIDRLDEKLDRKAEAVELEALAHRVANLESWRNRIIGVGSVLLLGVGIVNAIILRALHI